jgi:hypothetical protein
MRCLSTGRTNTNCRGASRNLAALKAEVDDKNGMLQSLRRSLAESDEKLARRSQQCRQLMDIVSVSHRATFVNFVGVFFPLVFAASDAAAGARKAYELD